jgi:hypothetical protein
MGRTRCVLLWTFPHVDECLTGAAPSGPVRAWSHSGLQSMQLSVGAGLGTNWTVTFTVKNQLVNTTLSSQLAALQFSFLPPVLHALSLENGTTSGGYNVSIYGLNFGTAAFFSAAGRVYVRDDIDGSPRIQATVVSVAQTEVVFLMPASQGRKQVFMVVDGQESNALMFNFSREWHGPLHCNLHLT